MIRLAIIVAILVAWANPLAAKEEFPGYYESPQSDGAGFASASDVPDIQLPGTPTINKSPAATKTSLLGFQEPSAADAEQTEADKKAAAERARLHAVCDCECRVPYLGPCCNPECCYGTTDEWDCHPCQDDIGNCYVLEDGTWLCNDTCCDVSCEPVDPYDCAVRLGVWGVSSSGSPNKVGEFEDLDSSPFWDIDAIRSNGVQTLDFTLTGLDNEANNARVRYYSPEVSANLKYQRFLRRLDHDPLAGAPETGPLGPADNVVVNDLNVGEDYAIRVQTLDAKFKGKISDNIKWRLNYWEQKKSGERQANATAHCFDVDPTAVTNNVCHVFSQRQRIDWTTVEVQPVVEMKFDKVAVEYSHTIRGFDQDDQLVDRQYTRFSPFAGAGNTLGAPFEYAFVPDTITHIDRIKATVPVTQNSNLYANLYYGDTENKFREIHRQFGGYDLRLIDRSIDRVTLTAYTSMYDQNNDFPPFLLTPDEPTAAALRHIVDHNRVRAGIKGDWHPFSCSGDGLSFAAGYEYYLLARDYATYDTALGPFTQPDTESHILEFGPSMRWSEANYSYLRYKPRFNEDPLIGVREANGRFNTKQPEQEHVVELGHTWTPAPNLIATVQFSSINRWHDSEFAEFNEDDYPFFGTVMYAPTDRLSLAAGYGYYSNWIDQDITLGYRFNVADQTETTRWSYAGENHFVMLHATYCFTPCLQGRAGYEFTRGHNIFDVPPSTAGADWSALPSFSDVLVEIQRLTAGFDYQPASNSNVYIRYVFSDWNDEGADLDSGTAHMVLAGATMLR